MRVILLGIERKGRRRRLAVAFCLMKLNSRIIKWRKTAQEPS
jgi:hypothetical protein